MKIVIVGAGFAGASTAWWLKRYGATDVLLIEREAAPGIQASGQNAAMARQATADPFLSKLLTEGVRFMAAPPKGFPAKRRLIHMAGSALMGSASQIRKMAEALRRSLPEDEFSIGETGRLSSIPYLAGIRAEAVLYTRTDGFVDLEALRDGFLDGENVSTSCSFLGARRNSGEPGGWILDTSRGPIHCTTLVIAAGAWSGIGAAAAGSGPIPLQPTTRHLFQSARKNEFMKDVPFVWDIATECYVRPDGSGALFLSSCDQDPYDPSTPLLPSRHVPRVLKEKLSRAFPTLGRIRLERYWPGTRTLTPDGRFVIGPDPKQPDLYWVAGMGGHGVTCSPAVGRIAAESILGIKPPPPEVSPERFV